MKRTFILLALACIATTAVAQQKLVDTVEVRVTNVDVVVRDRAGNPVTGLGKEDFEIYENGVRQVLTNLYEVKPEGKHAENAVVHAEAGADALPDELRVRRIVLLLDNYTLTPTRRNQVLKSMGRFVEEDLRPNDEVALAVWNRRISIITPFTTNRQSLRDGFAAIGSMGRGDTSLESEADSVKKQATDYLNITLGRRFPLSYQDAYSLSRTAVEAYASKIATRSQEVLESLQQMVTSLAGVDGKKIVVFAGGHLPTRPAAELHHYLYTLYGQYIRSLSPGGGLQLSAHLSPKYSIEKLGKVANANGVTLYVIDGADDRDSTSAEQSRDSDPDEQFMTYTNSAEAYRSMARVTGGVAVGGTNNFNAAFDQIMRDLSAYYSLGYRPQGDAAGERRITVKMKNAGYEVRTRRSYTPRSTEEEMNDRVLANAYHSGMKGEWKVALTAGNPEPLGDRFHVPFEVTMPGDEITLIPEGNMLVGGFNLYIVVADGKGGTSKVTKVSRRVEIPADAEKTLRSKPISFTARVAVRPGQSTLSIGVVDQLSNATGLAKAQIAAR